MTPTELHGLEQGVSALLSSRWPAMDSVCDINVVAKSVTFEVFLPFMEIVVKGDEDTTPYRNDFASKLALVRRLRKADASWKDVGVTLGTTRQAAWERFHDQIDH